MVRMVRMMVVLVIGMGMSGMIVMVGRVCVRSRMIMMMLLMVVMGGRWRVLLLVVFAVRFAERVQRLQFERDVAGAVRRQ